MGYDIPPAIRARITALATLRPPPQIALSAWLEANIVLPSTVASTSGAMRLWPFQRGLADAIGDGAIPRVSIMKSARIGYSSLLTGAVASYVANDPSTIGLLLPTEQDCRDVVVSDIEPIFAASPTLRGLLSDDGDPTDRSTLLSRRFPGGSLKILPARAPRNLRRHNLRVLLADEIDGMEVTAEGDPIKLAEIRTQSFPDRKIVAGSTPTTDGTSRIARLYAQSDQRVFEVECPECSDFVELLWAHIEWEDNKPETALFRCPCCGCEVEERHKAKMAARGRWRITKPEVRGHAGFRLNALISLHANASWGQLAAEFLAAKSNPDDLRVFVNTVLGQVWRDTADTIDEHALAARAEQFGLDAIPPGCLWVTLGCDVQDDRLECVLIGHTAAGAALILAHRVVWGHYKANETWRELDDLLKTTWPHPLGGRIGVSAAAVDSGDGEHSSTVLGFCNPRFNRRVIAIKGVMGNRPPLQASATKGSRLFIVGVDVLKAALLRRLSQGQSIRFSTSLEPIFYEQLTSERRVLKYSRGQPVHMHERIPGRRAEALDAVVYATAVRDLIRADPERRAAELASDLPPPAKAQPTVWRSKWLEKGRL